MKQKDDYVGHDDDDDDVTKEIEEDHDMVNGKAMQLAKLLSESKNVVLFTGAGISTSAGIPDYRGKKGLWTTSKNKSSVQSRQEQLMEVKWFPTVTHMFIKRLVDEGLINHIITQNCDDLHEVSGVPQTKLITLHGNSFTEVCPQCSKTYKRDFVITQPTSPFIYSNAKKIKKLQINEQDRKNSHQTERTCDTCNCNLLDTIVNFGEAIPDSTWNMAADVASKADLMIVIGTSLKVVPAMNLPTLSKKYVICNLQRTPMDASSEILIHTKCDNLSTLVAKNLSIDIPSFLYCTCFKFLIKQCDGDSKLTFLIVGEPNQEQIESISIRKSDGRTTYTTNSHNNFTVKFPSNKKCVDVALHMIVTMNQSYFATCFFDHNSSFLDVIIPGSAMTGAIQHEASVKLVYDSVKNEWDASPNQRVPSVSTIQEASTKDE
ncbi:SIRT7, partial [Acrasis kona]